MLDPSPQAGTNCQLTNRITINNTPETADTGPAFVPSMKDRAAMAAALWELPVDGRWNLGLTGAEAEFWLTRVWATLDNFPSDVNCDESAAIAAARCVDASLAPAEALGVRRLWAFCNMLTKSYKKVLWLYKL